MKYIAFILVAFLPASWLNAQHTVSHYLQSIEQNNTTLEALRHQTAADKTENHTGINIENPEVEFGYLWGNKTAAGNKYDLSIKQSFDFPTSYRYKKQLARQLDKQAGLAYENQKREILLEARTLLVELTYRQLYQKTLNDRVENAHRLFEAYQLLLDRGDTDIIEYNKTRLNLINLEKTRQINEIEISTLQKELRRLNGGTPLPETELSYSAYILPFNFDEWFTQTKTDHPALQITAGRIQASRKQVQLARSLNLPKLSAGYAKAYEEGYHFNGFTVGISIPLWENKNKVKAQKARTIALQSEHHDNTLQYYNTLSAQYQKAKQLQKILDEYKQLLNHTNDHQLLQKAFQKGKLSLIPYLQELTIWYETIDQYLETERDYHLTITQLIQWSE